jgi:hypothetical protein
MADYGCHPLWEYSDDASLDLYANPDPTTLPLSKQAIEDLNAWARWFDSFINLHDPYNSRDVPPEERAAFDREGRRLWKVLREELGVQWVVTYFEGGKLLEPKDDRSQGSEASANN